MDNLTSGGSSAFIKTRCLHTYNVKSYNLLRQPSLLLLEPPPFAAIKTHLFHASAKLLINAHHTLHLASLLYQVYWVARVSWGPFESWNEDREFLVAEYRSEMAESGCCCHSILVKEVILFIEKRVVMISFNLQVHFHINGLYKQIFVKQ